MNKLTIYFSIILAYLLAANANGQEWQEVETSNLPVKRSENAFVRAGDKLYLIGGRGVKPVEIYDPEANSWSRGATPPVEMHHFQAVEYMGLIYVMGGLSGSWPYETPLSHVYIYDPLQDLWVIGPEIPSDRQRGAAGAVAYNDKIYLVCGIVNGHTSGWVPWFDVFDPATNTWHRLPDAPRARDHFQAVVTDNKLIVTGGRKSGYQGQGFEATIAETDIYDFNSESWTTLPSPSGDIPTQRAGCTAVVNDGEVIIIGGESGSQVAAHNEVEALNVSNGNWRSLPSLKQGRHGTQVIMSNGDLYIAAGCGNRGGSPELNSLEFFDLNPKPSSNNIIKKGTLSVNQEIIDFKKTDPYTSKKIILSISNKDGNQGIPVSYIIATDSRFTIGRPYQLPLVIQPGKSIDLTVKFTPDDDRNIEGNLIIKPADKGKGEPLIIPLSGYTER